MDSVQTDETNAFLAVLETGSYTAAGRKIGRDGSVISRRVAALETRLGIRLLERTTRRVSATDAGLRYRERVREAMSILRSAEDEARSMATTPAGLLRVSLPAGFGRKWIVPRLPEFLARYPAIELECSLTDRYVDLIAERYDLGVRIGKLEDNRLVAKSLLRLDRLLCASPAWLDAHAPIAHPRDLLRYPVIGFTALSTYPVWHLNHRGEHQAIRIRPRFATNDADAAIHAAFGGVGVVLGADWLVASELRSGSLVHVLPEWIVSDNDKLSVVRASRQHEPAKTRVFVEWISALFARPPWLSP